MPEYVTSGLWGLAAAGITCALVGRWVERRAGHLGLLDVPNARSSHVLARPRGGGLAILAGMAMALALAGAMGQPLPRDVWVCVAATMAVALAGLIDDLKGLSVRSRLTIQIVVATGFVATLGGFVSLPLPPPLDVPVTKVVGGALAVLWLVGVTNFFNFMDGADGLATGQAAITLSVLGLVLGGRDAGWLACVAAAAAVVFLWSNWAPARVFLGDVGSGALGFLIAALPLVQAAGQRGQLTLLVAMSMALFLLDPAITLVRRTCQGRRIGEAHRDHLYQRLFRPGESHAPVVIGLLTGGLTVSALGLNAYYRADRAWESLLAIILVFCVEWRIATARRRA